MTRPHARATEWVDVGAAIILALAVTLGFLLLCPPTATMPVT